MDEIQIIEGKLPILLSAPHVYSHYRSSLKMSLKQGEMYTDEIVIEIARRTNCYAIYTTKELSYDPNYSLMDSNPYKQEVERLMKEKKLKTFIDFHGLSDNHKYDLGIYYMNRYLKSKKLALGLANHINSKSLRGVLFQLLNFKYDSQETLSEFVSIKLKRSAIQLEIAKYIREEDQLRNDLITLISDYLIIN